MKNHGVLVTPRITDYCKGTITDEYTEHIRGTKPLNSTDLS